MRFAYVTSLRAEGKQTHILYKPKTLATQEMRQRATKYCHWEIMLIVYTVHAPLSATPLISLPFTSNGPRTQRFAPTTVPNMTFYRRPLNIFGNNICKRARFPNCGFILCTS
jgi:hypothetical protein